MIITNYKLKFCSFFIINVINVNIFHKLYILLCFAILARNLATSPKCRRCRTGYYCVGDGTEEKCGVTSPTEFSFNAATNCSVCWEGWVTAESLNVCTAFTMWHKMFCGSLIMWIGDFMVFYMNKFLGDCFLVLIFATFRLSGSCVLFNNNIFVCFYGKCTFLF